jgi:hypothetical protein
MKYIEDRSNNEGCPGSTNGSLLSLKNDTVSLKETVSTSFFLNYAFVPAGCGGVNPGLAASDHLPPSTAGDIQYQVFTSP